MVDWFGLGILGGRTPRYNFTIEEGDDGIWAAECLEVQGAYGQGATADEAVEDAKSAARDIIRLRVGDARRSKHAMIRTTSLNA